MFSAPKLTALPISTAQVEMELMFLNSHNQQHCLELIMQLEADSRGPYLQQFVQQHSQHINAPARRYHSVMEWFMAA